MRVKNLLPIELRVAGHRQRPGIKAQRQRVRAAMDLPPSLRPRQRDQGSVWAVTMVKNEEDTIGHVLDHLLEQGVNGIVVADNLSTDGTAAILQRMAETAPIHVVQDRLVEYHQNTKMTILADIARRSGADWVVPFDADELWFASGATLAEHLRACSATVARAVVYNVFPSREDDPQESNPFRRIRHMDTTPHRLRKVAFRTHRFAELLTGNHAVTRRGAVEDGLYVAHYPWRSFEQFRRKVTQGAVAIELAGDSITGAHWRQAAAWSVDDAARHWEALLRGEGVPGLLWSPNGPFVDVEPLAWPCWRA